jgi:hypothetical protein
MFDAYWTTPGQCIWELLRALLLRLLFDSGYLASVFFSGLSSLYQVRARMSCYASKGVATGVGSVELTDQIHPWMSGVMFQGVHPFEVHNCTVRQRG